MILVSWWVNMRGSKYDNHLETIDAMDYLPLERFELMEDRFIFALGTAIGRATKILADTKDYAPIEVTMRWYIDPSLKKHF